MMDKKDKYSAEDVAKLLQSEGYSDVTRRTVNYYAFDKGMFPVQEAGKKCFSQREVDKIRAIRLLKEHTNMTLEQIKKVINEHSLDEIKEICVSRTLSISPYYSQNVGLNSIGNVSSYCNSISGSRSVNQNFSMMRSVSENSLSSQSNESDKSRTIKVNNDITLILSSNVDNDKLFKLIDFIKNN